MKLIKYSTLVIVFQFYCLLLLGQSENKITVFPETEELYLKCGNKLKVFVASLPSEKSLQFKLDGGTIRLGKGINEVFIYPNNIKAVLYVYQGDQLIGSKEFKVKKTFKPNIVYLADDKIINNGIVPRETKSIQLKAVCDSAFACVCPIDKNYFITYTISYFQNGKLLKQSKMMTNSGILKIKYMKSIDHLIVELDAVKKITYLKEEIDLNFEKSESKFLVN